MEGNNLQFIEIQDVTAPNGHRHVVHPECDASASCPPAKRPGHMIWQVTIDPPKLDKTHPAADPKHKFKSIIGYELGDEGGIPFAVFRAIQQVLRIGEGCCHSSGRVCPDD